MVRIGREPAFDLERRHGPYGFEDIRVRCLEIELSSALADKLHLNRLVEHALLDGLAHFIRHARLAHRSLDAGHLVLVIAPHLLDRDLPAVDLNAAGLGERPDADVDTPEHEDDAERDQDRDRENSLQLVVDGLEHGLAGAAKNGALG